MDGARERERERELHLRFRMPRLIEKGDRTSGGTIRTTGNRLQNMTVALRSLLTWWNIVTGLE